MARRSPDTPLARRCRSRSCCLGLVVVAGAVTLWQAWGSGGDDRADGGSPSAQPSTSASPSPGADRHRPVAAASPSGVPTPGPINTAFPGITTFRGNATRDYYGEGPVPMHPVIRWNYPESGGALLDVGGRRGLARLVRDRVDRAAERDRARRRHDRDPRGRVRRALPLPQRPDRTSDAARPGDGRPREGLGDVRPGGLPAVLRGLARQPVPHRRDGPAEPPPCCGP